MELLRTSLWSCVSERIVPPIVYENRCPSTKYSQMVYPVWHGFPLFSRKYCKKHTKVFSDRQTFWEVVYLRKGQSWLFELNFRSGVLMARPPGAKSARGRSFQSWWVGGPFPPRKLPVCQKTECMFCLYPTLLPAQFACTCLRSLSRRKKRPEFGAASCTDRKHGVILYLVSTVPKKPMTPKKCEKTVWEILSPPEKPDFDDMIPLPLNIGINSESRGGCGRFGL